jgi:hypothetical protein
MAEEIFDIDMFGYGGQPQVALGVRFDNPLRVQTPAEASMLLLGRNVYPDTSVTQLQAGRFGPLEQANREADRAVALAAKAQGYDAIIRPREVQVIDKSKLPSLQPLDYDDDEGVFTLPNGESWGFGDGARAYIDRLTQMRDLGGPGSGHHGHAGRPGAVGGSAPVGGGIGPRVAGPGAVAFTNHLARLPGALEASAAKQITIANTDAEAAEKIDDYLLKHYGFDLQSQAASVVDRDRGVIISTQREAPAAAARTMTPRFMSPEWIAASRKRMGLPPEESFVDAFSALFTEGQPLFEVARHEDPLVFPLEAAVDVFKQWGWL